MTAANRRSKSSSPKSFGEPRTMKNIVILGVAYGGARAAVLLSKDLPEGWRVIAIDRNTHFNHVYVFPRFTVLPELPNRAASFIPYTRIFQPLGPVSSTGEASAAAASTLHTPPITPTDLPLSTPNPHLFLQSQVVSLQENSVTLDRAFPEYGLDETIDFEYCIYALGSQLPAPCDVWSENSVEGSETRGTKAHGMGWMMRRVEKIKRSQRVVVIGGGALGIQYASDVKSVYPDKDVTLIHSRSRLLPIYPQEMHDRVAEHLRQLGVKLVLGERVSTPAEHLTHDDEREKIVRTGPGGEYHADLVLVCTGQKPNNNLLATLAPECINPLNGRIRVQSTLQIDTSPLPPPSLTGLTLVPPPVRHQTPPPRSSSQAPPSPAVSTCSITSEDDRLGHIFAVGDCASTGAIQAGHTAYNQAEVAARNIATLVKRRGSGGSPKAGCDDELEVYQPGPPAIKVTVGGRNSVTAIGEAVTHSGEGEDDLMVTSIWPMLNAEGVDVNA